MSEIEAAVRAASASGKRYAASSQCSAGAMELSYVASDSRSRSNKRTRSSYEAKSSAVKVKVRLIPNIITNIPLEP